MRGKNSSRWHCRACNKAAFGSEGRAIETIEKVAHKEGHVPRRAYECPYGNGWHLTSKEDRYDVHRRGA